MIVVQSLATALAERLIDRQKPVAGMSSPAGEDTGEGELSCSSGREPALTVILAPDFWMRNSGLGVPAPCRLQKKVEIAKRTQFHSQHAVFKILTTKNFPFCSKANLIAISAHPLAALVPNFGFRPITLM